MSDKQPERGEEGDQREHSDSERHPTQRDYDDDEEVQHKVAKTSDYAIILERKRTESNNNNNNIIHDNGKADHEGGRKIDPDLMSTDSVRGSLDDENQGKNVVNSSNHNSPVTSDHHVAFPIVDRKSSTSAHQISRSHQSSGGLSDKVAPVAAGRARLSSAGAQSRAGQHTHGHHNHTSQAHEDEHEDHPPRTSIVDRNMNHESLIRKSLIPVSSMSPADPNNNNNNNSHPRSRHESHSSKWSMKSNGRKWLTSVKMSLWFTSVFTFIFCFFYFFLHVLLLVKVWDPVHTEPPVRDAADQVDQFMQSLSNVGENSEAVKGFIISGKASGHEKEEVIDDHRHSREKSILSLILILVLSFHSIMFYIFSSTLSKSIRKIDSYHRDLLFHASIDPPVYSIDPTMTSSHHHPHHHHNSHHHHHRHSSTTGLTHASNTGTGSSGGGQFPRHYRETSTWKLQHSMPEDVHHEQYYYRKSRARSRLDQEMGITRRDRHILMYSFFGVLIALLCLLIHVMIQFVFCLALYQPFMDLMDCLLLIFSSFIIIFSLTFIFIASYYHRKKIYA